jgi:putative flippase GtrA
MNSLLRFLLVGIFNTCFGYSLIFGFMYLAELSPELSNLLGYSVALLVSFVLHKYFTFARGDVAARSKTGAELLRFLISFACAYAANYATLLLLIYQLEINAVMSQLLAGVVYVGISYFLNARFAFRYF